MKLKNTFIRVRYFLLAAYTVLVFIGGHSIGQVSQEEVLTACLLDLNNQCGLTIDYALMLEKENAKLNKDVKLLTENLLDCVRNAPMLPHIRHNNDDH